jgi:hypothetical protein
MNEHSKAPDSFEVLIRAQVTGEVAAAVEAGDEERAFSAVTFLADVLQEIIGIAAKCDEDFVNDCKDAVEVILDYDVDIADALPWPTCRISNSRRGA